MSRNNYLNVSLLSLAGVEPVDKGTTGSYTWALVQSKEGRRTLLIEHRLGETWALRDPKPADIEEARRDAGGLARDERLMTIPMLMPWVLAS